MSLNLNSILQNLEADAQIEKAASVASATKPAISAEVSGILEKKASADLLQKAAAEGEELARQLLSKVADELGAGEAVNNINADNAAMAAFDDAKVLPNPNGGTIEGVLQGTVDNGKALGATTDDRVDGSTQVGNVVPAGGPVEGSEQSEENMNKQANSQLAQYIMNKLAQEFSQEVSAPVAQANVAAAAVPNKIQEDNAVMTAQDDAKVQGVVPAGDGTVNSLFETIVARAMAQGAQSDDLVNGNNGGHVESRQTQGVDEMPNTGEEQEKAAAVSALCDAGMDFDTAVSLVKQAEEDLIAEAWEHEKQAAVSALVEHGVDFDTAVELTKQAEQDLIEQNQGFDKAAALNDLMAQGVDFDSAVEYLSKEAGTVDTVARYARRVYEDAKDLPAGVSALAKSVKGAKGSMPAQLSASSLAHNSALHLAAGGAAVAGGAVAAHRAMKKAAALNDLMAQGVDFDSAVEYIQKEAGAKQVSSLASKALGAAKGYARNLGADAGDLKAQMSAVGKSVKGGRKALPLELTGGTLARNRALHLGAAGVAGGAAAGALAARRSRD